MLSALGGWVCHLHMCVWCVMLYLHTALASSTCNPKDFALFTPQLWQYHCKNWHVTLRALLLQAQSIAVMSHYKIHWPRHITSTRQLFDELKRDFDNHLHSPFTGLHASAAPGAGWTPSGCCSRPECGRPPAACQQKSGAAGLGGCPPCPGFWTSHSQWCRTTPPPE